MRIDYHHVQPAAVRAMLGLERAVHDGPLEASLIELVKVRASQLNRCAHCLEMHTKDARARGESDDRLHLVAAWHEAGGMFTDRERAALAWCEELTLLADTGASDAVYEEVAAQFSDRGARSAHTGRRRHKRLEPLRRRVPRPCRRLLPASRRTRCGRSQHPVTPLRRRTKDSDQSVVGVGGSKWSD